MQQVLVKSQVIDGVEVEIFVSREKEKDDKLVSRFLCELFDFPIGEQKAV